MQTATNAALEQLAGIAWNDVRHTLLQDLKAMPATLDGVEEEAKPTLHQAIQCHIGALLDARRVDVIARVIAQCHATMLQLPGARAAPPQPTGRLGLRFGHTCLGLACSDADCGLCKHNPAKRCRSNEYFSEKYLEQDQLSARCGAELAIQAYNADTGETIAMPEQLIGKTIEVIVINGAVAPDGKLPPSFDFSDADQVLTSHSEGQPLLVPGVGARHNERSGVVLELQESILQQLPRIAITKSSESLLSGRKATFRLVAHVLDDASIVPAVSAPFVVATRRVKGNLKNDIPFVDEPLVKLDGIGRQTAEKLADIVSAARKAGVRIDLPQFLLESGRRGVGTVGELRELMNEAEKPTSADLKVSLLSMLKINAEQWNKTLKRVSGAVDRDNRLRQWTPASKTPRASPQPGSNGQEYAVLFDCKQGKMVLERPLGLVQLHTDTPTTTTTPAEPLQVIKWDELNSEQRGLMEQLKEQALDAWQQPRHPGWDACSVDADQLEQLGYRLPPREPPSRTPPPAAMVGPAFGGMGGVALAAGGPSGVLAPHLATTPGVLNAGPLPPGPSLSHMAQQLPTNVFQGGLAHLVNKQMLQPPVMPDIDMPSFPSNPLVNSAGIQALLGSLNSLPKPANGGDAAPAADKAAGEEDAAAAGTGQLGDSIPLVTLPGGGIASGISLGAFLGNLSDVGNATFSDLTLSAGTGNALLSGSVPGMQADGVANAAAAPKFGAGSSMFAELLKARGGAGGQQAEQRGVKRDREAD